MLVQYTCPHTPTIACTYSTWSGMAFFGVATPLLPLNTDFLFFPSSTLFHVTNHHSPLTRSTTHIFQPNFNHIVDILYGHTSRQYI